MDGFIMENPIKMADLGGFPPIFGVPPTYPPLPMANHIRKKYASAEPQRP